MRYFFLILLYAAPLWGVSLNETIGSLHTGDMLVIDFQQAIWVIEVPQENETHRTLSITSATTDLLDRLNMTSWITWAECGHPQANSHEELVISLSPFGITATSPKAHWFSTLLPLPLTKVPQAERRKRGIAHSGPDRRAVWNPPIILEGKLEPILSQCYSTTWPDDGSPSALQEFYIYIPEPPALAFPYWIETKGRRYTISVIDSKKSRP